MFSFLNLLPYLPESFVCDVRASLEDPAYSLEGSGGHSLIEPSWSDLHLEHLLLHLYKAEHAKGRIVDAPAVFSAALFHLKTLLSADSSQVPPEIKKGLQDAICRVNIKGENALFGLFIEEGALAGLAKLIEDAEAFGLNLFNIPLGLRYCSLIHVLSFSTQRAFQFLSSDQLEEDKIEVETTLTAVNTILHHLQKQLSLRTRLEQKQFLLFFKTLVSRTDKNPLFWVLNAHFYTSDEHINRLFEDFIYGLLLILPRETILDTYNALLRRELAYNAQYGILLNPFRRKREFLESRLFSLSGEKHFILDRNRLFHLTTRDTEEKETAEHLLHALENIKSEASKKDGRLLPSYLDYLEDEIEAEEEARCDFPLFETTLWTVSKQKVCDSDNIFSPPAHFHPDSPRPDRKIKRFPSLQLFAKREERACFMLSPDTEEEYKEASFAPSSPKLF